MKKKKKNAPIINNKNNLINNLKDYICFFKLIQRFFKKILSEDVGFFPFSVCSWFEKLKDFFFHCLV